jgi:hypothetical protein
VLKGDRHGSNPRSPTPLSLPLVYLLVCPSPLLLGQGGDELAAEGGDVGDDAAPDQVKGDAQTSRTCIRGSSRGMQIGSPFLTGVLTGVVRTARGGHGPGDRLTLAARSEPTSLEEGEEAPTSSSCST